MPVSGNETSKAVVDLAIGRWISSTATRAGCDDDAEQGSSKRKEGEEKEREGEGEETKEEEGQGGGGFK